VVANLDGLRIPLERAPRVSAMLLAYRASWTGTCARWKPPKIK